MTKTLTDLSQLTKAILGNSPSARSTEKPAPAKEPRREDDDAAAVLAYFSRPARNAPGRARGASPADPARASATASDDALKAGDAALGALAEEKARLNGRVAELEHLLAAEREAHQAAARERDRLLGECGRLQGELRKRDEAAPGAAPDEAEPAAAAEPPRPARDFLTAPEKTVEAFPGETREHVIAALAESMASARQSGRDRRADVLADVLEANRPNGELDRRRAELKQILKDAGGFADAGTLAALERIGIRCISGRKHWKLEYADIRMPMSKTPSDYRSARNCAADMANRCF